MKLFCANDWHYGVLRSAGTTPQSAWALRQYILTRSEVLLDQIDGPLVFNGDLFDAAQVPNNDFLQALGIFRKWLAKGHHLYLGRANHDVHRVTSLLSSFDLFGELLKTLAPDQVTVVTAPTAIPEHNAYMVPHLINQDAFDLALTRVPAVDTLFVHCNYDNHFAQESDHSLNMSEEQAKALPVKRIIFGHEHQAKSALNGKVIVVGNQIPSSISDCLGNDAKYLIAIENGQIETIPVWDAAEEFSEVPWTATEDVNPSAQFVRVTGTVTPAQASDAIAAISLLRKSHTAFVVANATKPEVRDGETEKLNLETIQSYDILAALLKRLTPQQAEVVKQLLKEHDVSPT